MSRGVKSGGYNALLVAEQPKGSAVITVERLNTFENWLGQRLGLPPGTVGRICGLVLDTPSFSGDNADEYLYYVPTNKTNRAADRFEGFIAARFPELYQKAADGQMGEFNETDLRFLKCVCDYMWIRSETSRTEGGEKQEAEIVTVS